MRAIRFGRWAAMVVAALVAGCSGSDGTAPTVLDPGSAQLDVGLDQFGAYPVGVRTLDLVDESRPADEFSNGPRFLKTEVWYPAAESARNAATAPATDWVPSALRSLVPFISIRGHRVFDFPTHGVRNAAIAAGSFPLIVFSHGHQAVRYQSFTLTEHLASHGFVVVAPDHIGNAGVSERADGSLVLFSDAFGEPALDRRLADVRFLVTTFLDLSGPGSGSFLEGAIDDQHGVGLMGHSFGGATTVAGAAEDSRITAAMPMAAAIFENRMPPFTIPSVVWIGAEDNTIGPEANAANRQIWEGSSTPRVFADIRDAGHFTFSDACLLLPGFFLTDGCGDGTRIEDGSAFTFIDHDRAFTLLDATATAFFSWQLQGRAEMGPLLRANPAPAEVRYQSVGF